MISYANTDGFSNVDSVSGACGSHFLDSGYVGFHCDGVRGESLEDLVSWGSV